MLLPLVKRHASDERNFVKKAVNWALRNIGKRNLNLNRAAIRTAKELTLRESRSARWTERTLFVSSPAHTSNNG